MVAIIEDPWIDLATARKHMADAHAKWMDNVMEGMKPKGFDKNGCYRY